MKSSLLCLIMSAFVTQVAFAQISTKPSAQDLQPNKKTSFQKFSDRLRIGYFGVFTSPHFDDIEKGQWRNAAISPEFGNAPKGEQKNHDTWPTNFWNQVSFNYNFGAKMNFVINPRFMIGLASSRDMNAPERKSTVYLDDVLIGFQGVVYSSEDKKFNLWIRPGMRLPTSAASRDSGNAGFGSTTRQVELGYNPTYDFTKTWQLGVFGQVRQWTFDEKYNASRLRLYQAPYLQYTIDDTSRIQVYYELMLENASKGERDIVTGTRRSESVNGKPFRLTDVWQNVMIGYNKDITSKLNVFPFFNVFVADQPITDKSLWIGAWISYQIK